MKIRINNLAFVVLCSLSRFHAVDPSEPKLRVLTPHRTTRDTPSERPWYQTSDNEPWYLPRAADLVGQQPQQQRNAQPAAQDQIEPLPVFWSNVGQESIQSNGNNNEFRQPSAPQIRPDRVSPLLRPDPPRVPASGPPSFVPPQETLPTAPAPRQNVVHTRRVVTNAPVRQEKDSAHGFKRNFCDTKRHSSKDLVFNGLQRVDRFIGSLNCQSIYYECAVGFTFERTCRGDEQAFDLTLMTCNYRRDIKYCPEYDPVAHCDIRETCGDHDFVCCASPQKCIPNAKRCDGRTDCADGADEHNCPTCGPNEMPCLNSGRCIPAEFRCNGIPDDCGDGTNEDEQDCSICPPDSFQCTRSMQYGPGMSCVTWDKRCDGVNDCPNQEDEHGCKRQGPKYILCENQLHSVSALVWCDGKHDCLDGSDEKYCGK